jgi:putative DNA primase/helicase
LLGNHPGALAVFDLDLTPAAKYEKSQLPGSSANHPSLLYDWSGVKTVGLYTGPAVRTLVIDVDDAARFRAAVDKIKPPADRWKALEGALVSFHGDATAVGVRTGTCRGKLIFRLADNEAIARCAVGRWLKPLGIDVFYGKGIPSILGDHPDGTQYRLEGTLGEAPGWLLERLTPKERVPRSPRSKSGSEGTTRDRFAFDHVPDLAEFDPLMVEIEAVSPELSRTRVGWEPKLHEGKGIIVGRCPHHTDGVQDLHAGYGNDGTPYVHCKHTTCEAVNHLVNAALPQRRRRDRAREQINPAVDGAQRAAPNSDGQTTVKQGATKGRSGRSWKKLRPIRVELRQVPPMIPDLIPEPFQGWAVDCAERASCPLDLFGIGTMVSVASVVGRQVGIRPKRQDDWLVVSNLWGIGVLPPGWLKTHTLEEAKKPLVRLEQEARKRYEQELANFEVEKLIADNKAAAAETMLKNAAKQKKSDVELKELAVAALVKSNPRKPTRRRFIINDATVEKLGELLAENPIGLLVYRDELMGFLRSLEKEGHENDRGFYLEAWNGTGAYSYDRIARGTIAIDPAVVSILGGIQPGRLAAYIRDTASGDNDDGLIQRFQLAVYPDTDQPFRNVDRWPEAEKKNRAYAVFQKLEALDISRFKADGTGGDEIPYLRFASDAQELFDEWRCALEMRIRSSQERACLTMHLGKYRSLMPSLALLFHLIDVVDSGSYGPVSLSATKLAVRWCEYLEAHARRIYQAAFEGDSEPAQRLAERIKESLPNPFAVRDVVKKGWCQLNTVDDVERAVALLEEHGWVCQVEVKPGPEGGRTKVEIWINPEIRPETATGNETPMVNETPTVNESSADQDSTVDDFFENLAKDSCSVGFAGTSNQTRPDLGVV